MDPFLTGIATKSTVVLGTAGLTAWTARNRSAAARHMIWTAALVALLALPFLSISLPALHVPVAERVLIPEVTFQANAYGGTDAGVTPGVRVAAAARSARWRPDWNRVVTYVWGAGAALGCLQLTLAWIAIWRLGRRLGAAACAEVESLARTLGIGRDVRIVQTAPQSMPMAFGWLHPTVFLPEDAAAWSTERRRAVLLHELAHVRRGDVVTQLFARLALSLYWWNPLAWVGWREFLKLRERAADDLVLATGTHASEYASHLLDIARLMTAHSARAVAAVAMAHPSQLEGRLRAILDARMNRQSPGKLAGALALLAAIAVVAPMAAIRAQDPATQAVSGDVEAVIRSATTFTELDRVADGYIRAGQIDNAHKVLEAALSLRARGTGVQSDLYADGLLKLGDLAWENGWPGPRSRSTALGSVEVLPSALEYYEKAVALGDRTATATALLRLGILNARTPETAAGYLERSLRVRPTGPGAPEALAWMGMVQDAMGRAGDAEPYFFRAESMAVKDSPDEALALEMHATFLGSQDREDEAKLLRDHASRVRGLLIAGLSPRAWDSVAPSRIGGVTAPPKVSSKVEPQYSQAARVLKLQGTVVLNVVIGTNGKAGDFKLMRALGYGLDEQAVKAVSQWQFQPGQRDGQPVPVIATIEINFRLL